MPIHFSNLIKKYNNNTVIPGLTFDIKKGEFFTLLGPSGCGKTTLLRMVAGFNSIEGGKISFGDKLINNITPQQRNIGMVFQNYAIFPHLDVRNNVAFGLENKKIAKDEIENRVRKILDVVQMSKFRKSLPENLSGGQQQRIALARAIVIEPDVLLMDEPLSNLDAKLRVEMREAIKEIQKRVEITTIYVTHDQEEAMAVSDRIAVMNAGEIQQIGSPRSIYQRPSNIFVANFIGRTNIIERDLKLKDGRHMLILDDQYEVEMKNITSHLDKLEKKVKLSIRPEEFIIDNSTEGMEAIIKNNIFLGMNIHYFVELKSGEQIEVIQESTIGKPLGPGSAVNITVKKEKINLFDYETELNILEDCQNESDDY